MHVETIGLVAALHLRMLRVAAKTGHIRRAAIAIGRVFPPSPDVLVHLDGAGTFAVSLHDHYWARILVGWEHEPEVRAVLDAAIAYLPDAVLFDCGANLGYWGARYAGRVPVVAVEAVAPTYVRLSANAHRNGFRAVHAAIWHKSGQSLTVQWDVSGDAGGTVTEQYRSNSAAIMAITLDELSQADPALAGRPAIVKLDVEGAELHAIEGAEELRRHALWVYEDHGMDPTHKVTARFLELGFEVSYTEAAPTQHITSLGQLDRIKVNVGKGYNFVAHHLDGPWARLPGVS